MVIAWFCDFLHNSEILRFLILEIILCDFVLNRVNTQNIDCLLMAHTFLIPLSSLFLENHNFLSRTFFFNCGVNFSFGNSRPSDCSVVSSTYEKNIIDANLITNFDIFSKHFNHDSVIFDYLVLYSFNSNNCEEPFRMHWKFYAGFGVMHN